jgi:hypothetical protein
MESFNGCQKVRLLDSQDIDYSVKLQKLNKIAIATAKRQLHQQELITMKH